MDTFLNSTPRYLQGTTKFALGPSLLTKTVEGTYRVLREYYIVLRRVDVTLREIDVAKVSYRGYFGFLIYVGKYLLKLQKKKE